MKVGIFETEHYEGAYPVIRLFDIPSNNLVIFTTPETYKRFNDLFKEEANKFQWVILNTKGRRVGFFRQLYREAKKHRLDIFYINTISSNHLLFAGVIAFLRKTRIILTLHDINCMFNSRWSWKPRKMAHHIGKRYLLRLVKEFNVVSDTMISYLRDKTRGKKIIHNFPGAVFEHKNSSAAINESIHLVIPGSIDKRRRNYDMVFDLLRLAEEKKLPLRITILGGYTDPYGAGIIQKARSFPTHYTTLSFYETDVVLQDEFDRQLNDAHFIYIPSVINTTICFDIPEIYGLSKSSGNVFDVIKHAKPFIVPKGLRIPETLESSCFRHVALTDITQFINMLLLEKNKYLHWEQKALANSTEYTISKLREKNVTLLQGSQ